MKSKNSQLINAFKNHLPNFGECPAVINIVPADKRGYFYPMPERILIVHLGALGDLLLSRPALLTIRIEFPQAEIDFLGYPHLVSLVQHEIRVRRVYDIEYFYFKKSFLGNYDLIISFARKRYPEWEWILNLMPNLFIQTIPPPEIRMPVFEFQLQQLYQHGSKTPDFPSLSIPSTKISFHTPVDFLIHPGSGSPGKNWPPVYFAEVIKALPQWRAGLIIGPADKEVAEEILSFLGEKKIVLLKRLSLLSLAGIISKVKFFLGNDSGISHLAAALGVPSFVIFGPTDGDIWKPWGKRVRLFTPKVPCAPCSDEERKECLNRVCLKSIKPQEVIEGLEKCVLPASGRTASLVKGKHTT